MDHIRKIISFCSDLIIFATGALIGIAALNGFLTVIKAYINMIH